MIIIKIIIIITTFIVFIIIVIIIIIAVVIITLTGCPQITLSEASYTKYLVEWNLKGGGTGNRQGTKKKKKITKYSTSRFEFRP